MAVTIRTVAEEADVSPATVSRVFNDTAPVDSDTRERILETADRLGYVPNATARSLSLDRTHTFGVLLPFLTGEYFPEVIRGLDRAARDHDRLLMLSSSHHSPEDLRRALGSMNGRIDGLALMLPQLDPSAYKDHLPPDVPAVLLNSAPEGHEFSVLSIDSHEGARLATRHLVDQGHERIGLITGDPANREAHERRAGYRAALQNADLPAREKWIVQGDFHRASGEAAARTLLAASPRPTAVFASNDYMAMGLIRGLQAAGHAVPEDVAVVGFDDLPSAQHVSPALTTIDARMVDLGTEAIALLMEMTEGEAGERRVRLLAPSLRIRASCGATPCDTAHPSPRADLP
ncbi:MAG: LacI family DNA-binding transcriptional regulator [Salinibacter sp.]